MLKKGGSFACAIRKLEGKKAPVLNLGLRVGARVKIRPNTRFYTGSDMNPIDVEGVVTEVRGITYDMCLNLRVRWDNGSYNGYNTDDLEVVG